ncbi:MAG: biotin/lipoyl-containing protein [Verrucomicrobiota bacterium]|jgi:biotin carboxyl carrier protein
MKKLRVTVEGKIYEVLVEVLEDSSGSAQPSQRPPVTASIAPTPVVAAPAPASAAPSAPAAGGPGDVSSPLAGKVVSIDVKVGDTVAEGAQVATVEAMKMNTYIYASKAGRVAAIHVNAGDGVEEGANLLTIA